MRLSVSLQSLQSPFKSVSCARAVAGEEERAAPHQTEVQTEITATGFPA